MELCKFCGQAHTSTGCPGPSWIIKCPAPTPMMVVTGGYVQSDKDRAIEQLSVDCVLLGARCNEAIRQRDALKIELDLAQKKLKDAQKRVLELKRLLVNS